MSEDIFQCGRCKVTFTSLTMFFTHKREACTLPSWTPEYNKNGPPDAGCDLTVVDTFQTNATFGNGNDKGQLYTALSTSYNLTVDLGEQQFTNPARVVQQEVKCTKCCKTFKRHTNLAVHMKVHEGEKPFQCLVCGRCFSQNAHLQRHVQVHRVWPDGLSNTVPALPDTTSSHYSCSYCSVVLSEYTRFRIHLKNHLSKKLFKCIQGECSERFSDLEMLLQHVSEVHTHRIYFCHICDYRSGSLEDILNHQQYHPQKCQHKTKNKFNCLHCDACFGKLEKLTFHAASHSHQCTCPRCRKTFSSEKRLRSHLRTHEDTCPFQCGLCGARFRIKKYLTTHMLCHADSSHECSHCDKKFRRKDVLDRHKKIHQPRKMLDCPFKEELGCKLKFCRNDKLKLHLKTHVKCLISKNPKQLKSERGHAAKSTLDIVIIPIINQSKQKWKRKGCKNVN